MANSLLRSLRRLFLFASLAALVAGAAWFRGAWLPLPPHAVVEHEAEIHEPDEGARPEVLELSNLARKNMKIVSRPAGVSTYWRSIIVPGEVTDRPGISDRGVTSPAVGIVAQIHAFPGDTVRPGEKLFTLRLLSESIHTAQSDLFKVAREMELENEKRQRLVQIGEGAIPQVRIIDVDQQFRRLQAAMMSNKQDLLSRGLTPDQVAGAEKGQFVTTIDLVAPPLIASSSTGASRPQPPAPSEDALPVDAFFEVQELKVDLDAQVQAGQLLGVLASHRNLFIAGHAFKAESSALERAAQERWPIRIEFAEDDAAAWPALPQQFEIHHIANTIDPESRTFDFFVALANQSRSYNRGGEMFVVWRYRPGQRARLHVPIAKLDDVIVLPAGAVVRDGGEAYVFRQNGDLFDRRPVHVVHEDRLNVAIANDGSVAPGWYVAQSSAAALNRILEAQSASGTPVGVHVHADGSVHGAH
jgi:multidrug efflux pump subunit AcrA (membrane-fusion protein)